jgi:hypothetical protein
MIIHLKHMITNNNIKDLMTKGQSILIINIIIKSINTNSQEIIIINKSIPTIIKTNKSNNGDNNKMSSNKIQKRMKNLKIYVIL